MVFQHPVIGHETIVVELYFVAGKVADFFRHQYDVCRHFDDAFGIKRRPERNRFVLNKRPFVGAAGLLQYVGFYQLSHAGETSVQNPAHRVGHVLIVKLFQPAVFQFLRIFAGFGKPAVNHFGAGFPGHRQHFRRGVQGKDVVGIKHPRPLAFGQSYTLIDPGADSPVVRVGDDGDVFDAFGHPPDNFD